MKKRIVLYQRASTKKVESDTTNNQHIELLQWAEDNDYVVLGSFRDLKSGRSMESREGLKKALKMAQENCCGIAVVELSRLSRSIADTANLIDSGMVFHFTRSGMQMSKEMILFASLLNQMESEAISRRVSAGIQNHFARNPEQRKLWGAGSRVKQAKKSMDSARITKANAYAAKYGETIASLRNNGFSLRRIAEMLETMEIKTPRGNSTWQANQVRSVLKRYEGLER